MISLWTIFLKNDKNNIEDFGCLMLQLQATATSQKCQTRWNQILQNKDALALINERQGVLAIIAEEKDCSF